MKKLCNLLNRIKESILMKKTIFAGLSCLLLLTIIIGFDGGTTIPIHPPVGKGL